MRSGFLVAWAIVCIAGPARALSAHGTVEGVRVDAMVAGVPFATATASLATGHHAITATLVSNDELTYLEVPECAGRGTVSVDDSVYQPPHGPFVVHVPPGRHALSVAIDVSSYEKRVACSGALVLGHLSLVRSGFHVLDFASPEPLGGHAVLYVPAHHDPRPGPLLVGVHPWNGSMWTYAAIGELIAQADESDVPLLMPSGLGNALYVARAESEVFRAIEAAKTALAVDPARVSIWGASMGGAGATTIGLHRPDAFASITSFFGDSKYDLSTYVRSILPNEQAAHAVNALDVAENARWVPIWLIHGEADNVSPIVQSELLAHDLAGRAGYSVRFDRAPGEGHSGELVARYSASLVKLARDARAPTHPAHVTYRAVRNADSGAYGVRLERAAPGDAAFDVEYKGGVVRLISATNVASLVLSPGALGAPRDAKVDGRITVRWE
jgi:dienelactone hydrolase